jgi:hypothetical protein
MGRCAARSRPMPPVLLQAASIPHPAALARRLGPLSGRPMPAASSASSWLCGAGCFSRFILARGSQRAGARKTQSSKQQASTPAAHCFLNALVRLFLSRAVDESKCRLHCRHDE